MPMRSMRSFSSASRASSTSVTCGALVEVVEDRGDLDLVALVDRVLDVAPVHRDLAVAQLELAELGRELVGRGAQLARGELDLGQRGRGAAS